MAILDLQYINIRKVKSGTIFSSVSIDRIAPSHLEKEKKCLFKIFSKQFLFLSSHEQFISGKLFSQYKNESDLTTKINILDSLLFPAFYVCAKQNPSFANTTRLCITKFNFKF
jgi:hypothetical protein